MYLIVLEKVQTLDICHASQIILIFLEKKKRLNVVRYVLQTHSKSCCHILQDYTLESYSWVLSILCDVMFESYHLRKLKRQRKWVVNNGLYSILKNSDCFNYTVLLMNYFLMFCLYDLHMWIQFQYTPNFQKCQIKIVISKFSITLH